MTIFNCFRMSSSVHQHREARTYVVDKDFEIDILVNVNLFPEASIQQISLGCRGCIGTVLKVLNKHGYHLYHISVLQELSKANLQG